MTDEVHLLGASALFALHGMTGLTYGNRYLFLDNFFSAEIIISRLI